MAQSLHPTVQAAFVAFCALLAVTPCDPARAAPTDSAFSNVPSRFQTKELTVGSRALGEICLSRNFMPDGSACNPAFLAEEESSSLLGRVFFGNGYTALNTANNLIYQPISQDFLKELFQNQNVTSLEAHAGLMFFTKHFSASYSPYRVQYTSEVHNPNFAVVAIHAAVERSLNLAGGWVISDQLPGESELSGGVRVRYLSRDYVHGSFNLFQLIAAEDTRTLLPSMNQKAIFIDPYLGWVLRKHSWKPRAGFGVHNVGWLWPKDPLYPEPTDFTLGAGVEPPTGFGRLKLGIDIADVIHGDPIGRFRTGVSYQFGILEMMAGYNPSTTTLGLVFGFQIFQAGVVYEFVRSDFTGGMGNRIATEMSIKL